MAFYALLLGLVVFSPSSRVQSSLVLDIAQVLWHYLPAGWVTFKHVEVVMNVLMVAPLTLLGSMVWPRLRWQDWTTYGFLGAIAVELIQGLLLPQRNSSFSDIVANGAGACLGALVYRLVQRRFLRRESPLGS